MVWRAIALALALWPGAGVARDSIIGAHYGGDTTAYPHAVLGDGIEYTTLRIEIQTGPESRRIKTFKLPDGQVFEDLAPRLWDVTGDGDPEVVTVITDFQKGGALAIFDMDGFVTRTPHIGTRFRWLAPIGAADMDGDGHVEIGYIDRPHLAKTLRLWRFKNGRLREVASLKGLTNHRIGEAEIPGGVRNCGQGPELITADAGWQNVMATTFDGKSLKTRPLGPFRTNANLNQQLICP